MKISRLRKELDAGPGAVISAGGQGEFVGNVISGGDCYEMVRANACLSEGAYTFVLHDTVGDGICCK